LLTIAWNLPAVRVSLPVENRFLQTTFRGAACNAVSRTNQEVNNMFTPVMIGFVALAIGIVFFALRKDFGKRAAHSHPGGKPCAEVPEVSALDLRKMLSESSAPVVVMFVSPDCPACHTQKPNFQEAAETNKGNSRFVTINVKENKSTARRLEVRRIPTTMVFVGNDETPLDTRVGVFDPAAVNAFVTNAVRSQMG